MVTKEHMYKYNYSTENIQTLYAFQLALNIYQSMIILNKNWAISVTIPHYKGIGLLNHNHQGRHISQ